jgi:hypothetical protein
MLVKYLIAVILAIAPSLYQTVLKPCVTEDSVGCAWNAQTHGNGQGRSFWTDWDGNIHYVSK